MPQVFLPIDGDFLAQVHSEPDVFLVRVPCPPAVSGFTNCYIVQDWQERLFIDAGMDIDASLDVWMRVLNVLPRPARGKQALFLTHLHGDHSGLVSILAGHHMSIYVPRENYADFRQKSHPRYFESLQARRESEGISATDLHELGVYGASYYTGVPEDYSIKLVHEGQSLTVGRYRFKILDTSGHTSGHASLYCREAGLFFGGDHILFMVTPVLEAHIGRVDMLSRYLTSLHKVANLEVKALYHSHGPLRADHYERIAELETKQRRRAVEALEIVRSNPGATGNEVIRTMRWNTHAARWEDIDAAMRLCIIETGFVMLDHLTATGQATREMRDGFWRYFPC